MEYHPYDHETGKEKSHEMLVNTHEKIHSSVRIRMGVPGRGLEDSGEYNPAALEGWRVTGTNASGGSQAASLQQIVEAQKSIVWRKGDLAMPEEPLTELEYKLLNKFLPKLEPGFLSIVPK